MKLLDSQRFDSKVAEPHGDDCTPWLAARNAKGYGRFSVGGRDVMAHRYAWERANGPVPTGHDVCHRCDNPACVRVSHLFIGTRADNMADMVAKGRQNRTPKVWGSRHPAAKLTEADVADIRHARSVGVKGVFLAKVYGVTPTAITQAALGRTWSTQCA